MPQLDIDLFDDFIFFAFISLLFGFGDDESEEGIGTVMINLFLAKFYIENTSALKAEEALHRNMNILNVSNVN
jgi:hypothetical protein